VKYSDLAHSTTSLVFEDLSAKFTGNTVQRFDDIVIKQGNTVGSEYQWYKAYQDKSDIPMIYSYSEGALKMEYLKTYPEHFVIDEIISIVEKYKDYPVMGNHGFDEYKQRIAEHLQKNPINNGDKLLFKLNQAHLWPTFSHGDLSIRNIIKTKDGLKLIDPLYGNRFGSYILDYAKLLFTLKFFDGNYSAYSELMSLTQVPEIYIATECVRVATYNKRFNFIAENLIAEL